MKENTTKVITRLLLFIIVYTLSTKGFAQALDLTFNPGSGPDGVVLTTAIQSDGKIIIGGDFTFYDGNARNNIARLNEDGSLDNSFDPGKGASGPIQTISIQGDGKIIIGGEFITYDETSIRCIARLNVDGSLDTTFKTGTGASIQWQKASVFTSSIQDDGKIIIGGNFQSYNYISRNRIARLNTDGSLDTSFEIGKGINNNYLSGMNDRVLVTAIQSDGKIIIAGDFSIFPQNKIARLNTDGSIDTSFNTGTGANNQVITISIQKDGKIIIGGRFTLFDQKATNRIVRLNTDGSLDTSFDSGTPIPQSSDRIHATAIQSDGKIIIGGTILTYKNESFVINRFARLNTDGSLDTLFNHEAGVNSLINTISIQNDGKIIIGGWFNSYFGSTINNIARIDTIPPTVGIYKLTKHNLIINIIPNPFNYSTNISFALENNQHVNLRIFDLKGREVETLCNQKLLSGKHNFVFNAFKEPSGIYIYQLQIGGIVETGKIIKQAN